MNRVTTRVMDENERIRELSGQDIYSASGELMNFVEKFHCLQHRTMSTFYA